MPSIIREGSNLAQALPADSKDRISLGPFQVDLTNTRLLRDGIDQGLRLRAFRALRLLVENPGRLVSYDRLIKEAWDSVYVSHHTIAVTLREVKLALGECGSWITCRPKFGYGLEIPDSETLLRSGTHFSNQFTGTGFENALRRFQNAAQKGTADFRALEAIACTYLRLGAFLLGSPRDLHPAFLNAYKQAAALRELSPELKLDRSFAKFILEQDLVGAEADLQEIQRQHPGSADARARLSIVYSAGGRLAEALALIEDASEADLLLAPLAFARTQVRLYRREFDLAIECGRNALNLHPGSQFGRIHYAEALEFSGQKEAAVREYQLAGSMSLDAPWIRAQGARYLAKIGRTEEAAETLAELQQNRQSRYVDGYHLALLLFALGRRAQAFRELERAREEKSHQLLLINVDPKADPIRSDTRFAQFRTKVSGRS